MRNSNLLYHCSENPDRYRTRMAEGVRLLLENISSGPLLIVGHSTGGELQFMLKYAGKV